MENKLYELIILIFLFITVNAFGQENLLYEKIQREKLAGSEFKDIPMAFAQGTRDIVSLDHFIDPHTFYL